MVVTADRVIGAHSALNNSGSFATFTAMRRAELSPGCSGRQSSMSSTRYSSTLHCSHERGTGDWVSLNMATWAFASSRSVSSRCQCLDKA